MEKVPLKQGRSLCCFKFVLLKKSEEEWNSSSCRDKKLDFTKNVQFLFLCNRCNSKNQVLHELSQHFSKLLNQNLIHAMLSFRKIFSLKTFTLFFNIFENRVFFITSNINIYTYRNQRKVDRQESGKQAFLFEFVH